MIQDCEDSSNKRKREGSLQVQDLLDDHPLSKNKYSKSLVLDTDLHLETPMPSEWQRCLDIKSGQIYYYNTRTHNKTLMDPSSSMNRTDKVYAHTQTEINTLEPPKNMSLDLELNLPCGSSSSSHTAKKHHVADNFSKKTSSIRGGGGPPPPPSWLALEGGDQQQEMMTVVCKKCHMLVMMFKTSPSCPNCKFMHPPNQTPPTLFNNRELSLLC